MREIYINVVDIDIKFLPRHFCCNAVIEYYIFLSPRMIFQHLVLYSGSENVLVLPKTCSADFCIEALLVWNLS